MGIAYACYLSQANFGIIASEKPDFNRDAAIKWLDEHGGSGFFIRDEGSPWDCAYMADVVFHQIYLFETFNKEDIFHRIVMV